MREPFIIDESAPGDHKYIVTGAILKVAPHGHVLLFISPNWGYSQLGLVNEVGAIADSPGLKVRA